MKFIFFFFIFEFISLHEVQKTIYFIRHGETHYNTDPVKRVRGRIEIPLNDIGIAHCKAAGDFLAEEDLGVIRYSKLTRVRQTAEIISSHHKTKVEMFIEPLIEDISWGTWEGKTYQEAFGSPDGGDFFKHPETIIVPQGESFYSAMDRLRQFLVKFWESEEKIVTIISHGAISNIFSLIILQAPLEKFWSMYMSGCSVSKVIMKGIYDFTIDYWNAHHFMKDGEKKYLKVENK